MHVQSPMSDNWTFKGNVILNLEVLSISSPPLFHNSHKRLAITCLISVEWCKNHCLDWNTQCTQQLSCLFTRNHCSQTWDLPVSGYTTARSTFVRLPQRKMSHWPLVLTKDIWINSITSIKTFDHFHSMGVLVIQATSAQKYFISAEANISFAWNGTETKQYSFPIFQGNLPAL